MKNVKKTLLLALSFVLVAALSVVGTLAYLKDTDQDVNTMTYGNVHIAQHEYERAENSDELQEFTQGKPLYPATGLKEANDGTIPSINKPGTNATMNVVKGLKNVQDKFVFVENTGKNKAYVRTIVAYEIGTFRTDLTGEQRVGKFKDIIHSTIGSSWDVAPVGVVTIGDSNYYLEEYTYNTILEPGKYTADNSLGQVYMDSTATNEDCEALDGNGNGTYDILVFSQAVQADGFDNATTALNKAFGLTTEKNPWTDEANVPVRVSTTEALTTALSDTTKKYVVLEEDITVSGVLTVTGSKTLNLNGHNITVKEGNTNTAIYVKNENTELTITGNGTINAPVPVRAEAGTINIKGGTITSSGGAKPSSNIAVYVLGTGEVNIDNGTLTSTYQAIRVDSGKVNIKGGTLTGSDSAVYIKGTGEANINGGTINGSQRAVYVKGSGQVNIYDGTLNGIAPDVQPPEEKPNADAIYVKEAGIVNIKGGTLNGSTSAVYIKGTGAINIDGGTLNAVHAVWADAGTVKITDGDINGSTEAVYVNHNGQAYIYGGTYESEICEFEDGSKKYMTLNKNGKSIESEEENPVIEVYGGTFINFNPNDNLADGEKTDYVPTGYKVTSEPKDGKTYYTVSAE